MLCHCLASILLFTTLHAQLRVNGQPFEGGKEWDRNYTVRSVPPYRRAYLYRAFRDAPERKIVVFAEVVEDAATAVTHCDVRPFEQSLVSLPAIVTQLPFRHWGYRTLEQRTRALEEYTPVRVECSLPEQGFKHAAVSLRAGDQPLLGVAEVVDVPTQRAGTLAACVGPLVSGSLSQEWVRHHERLGVERFFSFVPSGKEYTDGKYNVAGDIPANILDYLQWSGTFRPDAVALTPQASVEYLLYSPPATTYYFGQFGMMHACWYMQRYAYDFVLYVDTDEFVWLESSFMAGPKPLQAWLSQVPASAATVTLYRYNYPPPCQPSSAHAPLVERAVMRQESPHWQNKLILRPKDVFVATNHRPVDIRGGLQWGYDRGDEIRVKHIRDGGFRYLEGSFDCSGMVPDSQNWRAAQGVPSWRKLRAAGDVQLPAGKLF